MRDSTESEIILLEDNVPPEACIVYLSWKLFAFSLGCFLSLFLLSAFLATSNDRNEDGLDAAELNSAKNVSKDDQDRVSLTMAYLDKYKIF